MKHLFPLSFLLAFYATLFAQSPKYRVISVPVYRHGLPVREPWTGGMDSPQFSECDLNNDGIKDLFVFDRVGDRVLTYLSNGDGSDTMYSYAPKYEGIFPSDLNLWALIRDYNSDGIPDIFTYAATISGPGTRVFKGSILDGTLHYNLVCPSIQYIDTPYTPYVLTNVNDVPVFTDVNGDGYIDIVDYNLGGTNINYFQNLTNSVPGNPSYSIDSFKYALVTSCWGNVAQNLLSNSMTLNISCKGGAADGQPGGLRHAGNSIYNIKDPQTGLVDLLNGNLGYDNLFFLRNCGTLAEANFCEWDSIYPTCNVPMFMPVYPAAYGIDVNADGRQDVLISPGVQAPYVIGGGAGRNVKNVMYYKNTGDSSCWYNYQTDSFLVEHTLDFGTESRPLFYDFDGDGLTDIVVGNYGYFEPNQPYQACLAFYHNTGTATSPRFTEISLDYDSLSKFGIQSFDPAFGDVDGDGKKDLIVGDEYGYLYFFKNMADTGSYFPSLTIPDYFNIKVGLNAAPFIYDVNGDSLPDLIVGMQDGTLSYFWNFGTKTNPMFSPDSVNTSFGNVNVTAAGSTYGYSQPYIAPDSAGNILLYVGSLKGNISEYLIDQSSLRQGSFTLLNNDVLKQRTGENTTISIADINKDGKMEYLVGTVAGGLLLYSDSLWDTSTILSLNPILPENALKVYPNPAREYFILAPTGEEWTNPKVELFNILGEPVNVDVVVANNSIQVNAANLTSGFYVVRLISGGNSYTAKILVAK